MESKGASVCDAVREARAYTLTFLLVFIFTLTLKYSRFVFKAAGFPCYPCHDRFVDAIRGDADFWV